MAVWQLFELFFLWFYPSLFEVLFCLLAVNPFLPSSPSSYRGRSKKQRPTPIPCSPLPIPLSHLPPHLLKKVVTKLDPVDYVLVQQTCKDMDHFIRSDRNLEVCFDAKVDLCWRHSKGSYKLKPEISIYDIYVEDIVKIKSLYGFRFKALSPPPGIYQGFEQFCNTLKGSCITATTLLMIGEFGTELTRQQCVKLFAILKPAEVHLRSYGSNRFEALLSSRTVKRVLVDVDPDNAFPVVKQLLPKFREIAILVKDLTQLLPRSSEKIYWLFSSILKLLRSEPLPRLECFYISEKWGSSERPPATEEIIEKFGEFDPCPVRKEDETGLGTRQYILKQVGPTGSCCQLAFTGVYAEIEFKTNA